MCRPRWRPAFRIPTTRCGSACSLPAKTPRAIVDRLHQESVKALQTPALREKLVALDVEPMPMTPAEFDAFMRDEVVAQAALVKAAGLKPN